MVGIVQQALAQAGRAPLYADPVQAGAAGVPVQFFLKAQPYGNPLVIHGFAKASPLGKKNVWWNRCGQDAWVEKKR